MIHRTTNNLMVGKPLHLYFTLSFAFFWLLLAPTFFVLFGLLRLEMSAVPGWAVYAIPIIGSWMPTLAAAIVTGVCQGWKGVRQLFARFFQFRLPARWYLAALIPAGITFVAAGIYHFTGGTPSGQVNVSLSFWGMLFVQMIFTGATGEEPGWRGFALPRLLERTTPLKAGLLLGSIWGLWHLPLWFLRPYSGAALLLYILAFNLYIISLTLLMTWIYLHTSHSLVPMVLAHFAPNFALSLVVSGLGLGPELPVLSLTALLTFVTALTVWAAGGFSYRASQAGYSLGSPYGGSEKVR